MMDENSWDVFCGKDVPGALWAGYHLCHSLVDRGRAVRLFTDGVAELSIAQPGIDADLGVQYSAGFQVIDQRVAPWCAPARNLVQSLGSPVVKAYLGRFTAQSMPTHWIDMITPWAARQSVEPLNPIQTTSTYRSYMAKIGDLPPCAGYVRQHSHPYAPLDRWSRRRGQLALLSLLGLPSHLLDHDFPVFASAHSTMAIEPWLRMLSAHNSGTCVFVPAGPLQSRLAPVLRMTPASTDMATAGSLTVVFLPLLTWAVIDELIGCCELALTDESDVALRAAMGGVPVLWGGDKSNASQLVDWSLAGAADGVRAAMLATMSALGGGPQLTAAWQQLMLVFRSVQAAAERSGARMQRAPEIADVLIAGVSGAAPQALSTVFAPTEPHGLVNL